ncbi:hypothetical protein [Estrella lausannensis]|uniref:Putative membrane protein n=1 Tax=Estrella lausannensis TaxID=483423 RepID=A0A0H5DPU9_9BACT|nr:hypothetical protein [Estrella lausannensis]CRX37534.1 Putative membrane protein [Estrella lausannensis]
MSFISDVAASFKPGSMTNPIERNCFGITGIVGAVMAIGLAILGAPAASWIAVGAISAAFITSAMIESRGLAWSAVIASFGLSLAAAALNPMPVSYWVVI